MCATGCGLTLKCAELPGNVMLNRGEANLPRKCVVNLSRIRSVDKHSTKENIGTLANKRLREIEKGLELVLSFGSLEDRAGTGG